MQTYVDEIMTGANKLQGIRFNITDEWIGAILLAELTTLPLGKGAELLRKKTKAITKIKKVIVNRVRMRHLVRWHIELQRIQERGTLILEGRNT